LPGGNYFDDVRLDLSASYREQDEWLARVERESVRDSAPRSSLRRLAYRVEPYRLREALVNTGLRRQWFEEFREYWENVVGGRPLTLIDFHNLRFAYRTRGQVTEQLSWESWPGHLANWQHPKHIFQTFDFVYRSGLHPAWHGRTLFELLERGWTVLEYGCAIAPMYRTWRSFLADRPTSWLLADIPGFPFHYARHVYGRDAEARFHVIEHPDDPLSGEDGQFDLILVQTVFEHLDRPRVVAEYLLERLRAGGLFWFDYPVTDVSGLNTPAGQDERRATLEFLAERLDVVRGELRIDDRPLGQCIGRKRA
jgi:hypothetical protein